MEKWTFLQVWKNGKFKNGKMGNVGSLEKMKNGKMGKIGKPYDLLE